MSSNEPRALTAALSSPAFVTKGGGLAMHVANRHVSRWAPEVGEEGANRIRPLRNLGFVDRLVSPWIESAQRSPSLRMFSQYISSGAGERPASNVSWVFPRPWYQDELDWMAAARAVGQQSAVDQQSAPQMFTTRGTYVAPTQPSAMALPTALYEFVAPSLSIARPDPSGVSDAYSPLVPLAATHAAQVMARVVAPMMSSPAAAHGAPAAARMSPGLRAVLSTMLERSAFASPTEQAATRLSAYAPELVTPPAPRAPSAATEPSIDALQAVQVAEQYAEQRARIADLQRVARVAAERELAIREAARPESRAERVAPPTTEATDRRAAVEAERAHIEQRISQRIAERTAQQAEAQRLHSSARDAAARDARSGVTPAVTAPVDAAAAGPENRVAIEIAAAVAALPPELSSMVASSIGSRPERAVQAIAELGEALRAVELMARNSASGGTVETTRGPRLVMPSGLGGLVATVERTSGGDRSQPRMPAFAASPAAAPIASAAYAPAAQGRAAAPSAMRVPAMAFLARTDAGSQTSTLAPTSALGAASAATPAALSHVAWSDRWLARFAGAKPQSLDMLAATSAAPEMRLDMLAAAAPGTVFVAPFFEDRARSMPAHVEEAPARAAAPQTLTRFDDDAETPDDVLMAIASAANRTRSAAATPAPAPVIAPAATTPTFDRETLADLVAHAPPQAPGAGLAAGLASSPFAPALRHVMPLGSAPTFDVRSLFGGGLGATYLAGLLAASTDEISIAAPSLPSWATWADASLGTPSLGAFDGEPSMRDVADWQPTYVAPEVPHADEHAELETAQAAAEMAAPLTTLRSALLSFDVETVAAQSGYETRVSQPSVTSSSTPLARTILESLSMPMLAETAAFQDVGALDVGGSMAQASSYAAPGMIADRAHAWSIAQERSTSDLAFDFVTPELVLAARVYGLGPAEAAQAARLAVAGPGQLTAMAGAVDRTFVQALAIENERRSDRGGRALATAYPLSTGDAAASASRSESADRAELGDESLAMPATRTFGVERRSPRGAFLWPAATTAALGMNAATPDGELSMSVAALELLAAQAVAELGTYAALGEHRAFGSDGVEAAAGAPRRGAMSMTDGGEPAEVDVLASAEAMVPSTRREKFQALYVALGQSAAGRSWSPAARAARALALAGRGDENATARERAAVAWDVMPVVFGLGEFETESTGDAAVRASRRRDELRALDPMFVDSRPGLGALSARAGEALGSYVTPSAGFSSPTGSAASGASSSSREVGAVLRAPTAAQEMVQTGRPAGRAGGGEVELPAWFEAAARKMLEDRSSVSDGISLAELTLVQTAAPQQIAASSRGEGGATHSVAPAPSAAAGAEADKIDIEKVANDVYREILLLMDVARSRNGEPYL